MKIASSAVAMQSTHHEASFSYRESMTMEAAKSQDVTAAILNLSAEATGKSYKESMAEYKKQQEEDAAKKRKENEARSLQRMAEQMRAQKDGNQFEIPDDEDNEIKMLRRILAALRGEKVPLEELKREKGGSVTDLRSAQYRRMDEVSFGVSAGVSVSVGAAGANAVNTGAAASGAVSIGTTASGTTWQRITAISGFAAESESTTFASVGMVKTADGRSIGFNVEVSMSRAFMSEINLLETKDYIKTDPLMINLDTDIGSVSDKKFFFDLDADGRKENISFAGKGSGFLALDKNNDGIINDGSELFGTKSGDGFKDLAAYDEDGNGWIDENDSIFDRLKVWTKDEDGSDRLIDLKKADVGAIYLGNANTQFSLKDDDNKLNAEIKKTGIYLKESSGAVGTLNHVDLVI